MSMTTQPARVFPAMTSHGNPAGVPSISVHACARAFARARAIRSSMAGGAGQVQRPADRRPARRRPEHRGQMGQHRDVAHAGGAQRDRRRQRDQHDPPVEQRRRALPSAAPRSGPAVSPAWSAALRSSTAPAWPTRPVPSAVTFRAWSHPLCCMAKSAPAWNLLSVVTGNLPEPGRSSPSKPAKGTAAPRPSPCHSRARRRSPRTHKVHSLPGPSRHEIPAHGYWNDTGSLSSPSALNSGG